ncbi:hypothetical protein NMY3_03706 [Candidatus Nitrosocosmicus oleophilus]|uniref:Uncharacterized protein n=1 Tax=Candidatus Nitrosocosmicus oleophilus TaxID=1353260 RepID=A0A654M2A6_9ARCH|nr:hypothetical protein NMY3_03706 [Candidatus Nitrosocosmicus oleophilus]
MNEFFKNVNEYKIHFSSNKYVDKSGINGEHYSVLIEYTEEG